MLITIRGVPICIFKPIPISDILKQTDTDAIPISDTDILGHRGTAQVAASCLDFAIDLWKCCKTLQE